MLGFVQVDTRSPRIRPIYDEYERFVRIIADMPLDFSHVEAARMSVDKLRETLGTSLRSGCGEAPAAGRAA